MQQLTPVLLQDAGGTATAHYKSTEDEILAAVRTGVKKSIHWCNEYPLFAYGGAVAALFVFPAPRSFVFKNIFGALQSQVKIHSMPAMILSCPTCP